MFRRGTEKGLMMVIPEGGHTHPISGVGARLEWKNAQKKPKKKHTSERIKRIIPHRSPLTTNEVW